MQKFKIFVLLLATVALLSACSNSDIVLSGKITYDNVPHNEDDSLNYNAISQDPVRGATIQLLKDNNVIGTATTNELGEYTFPIERKTRYILRVRAELKQTSGPSWDVAVIDNTNAGALYVLDSAEFKTGSSDLTFNLNAASGWNGTSYASTRSAAPFHILDRIYETHKKLEVIEPNLNLNPLKINWSPNNVAQSGDIATGLIGTSFYNRDGQIFLLGAANSDTDEYDGHVIIHEWAHYFEGNNSRSDSIGGAHAAGDLLDMRVAFGEGFGNAWSAIITDDPFYRDSFGDSQGLGFSINVEDNRNTNPGWYSEGSVQSILYDIYDATADDADNLELGLKPIYDVLIGQQKQTSAFTSIFSFMTFLKQENPSSSAPLDALLSEQSINTNLDIWGSNATNDGGDPQVLPIYAAFMPGEKAQVCTVTSFGVTNKLGNRRYLRLDINSAANYSLTLTSASRADVDGYIYNQGSVIAFNEDSGTDPAVITADLEVGQWVVEVVTFDAAGTSLTPVCVDARLTQN